MAIRNLRAFCLPETYVITVDMIKVVYQQLLIRQNIFYIKFAKNLLFPNFT